MTFNRIYPEFKKILRKKNQNDFGRRSSIASEIMTVRRLLEGMKSKNLNVVLLFVDFFKIFASIRLIEINGRNGSSL